jgi:hypothetical protein
MPDHRSSLHGLEYSQKDWKDETHAPLSNTFSALLALIPGTVNVGADRIGVHKLSIERAQQAFQIVRQFFRI